MGLNLLVDCPCGKSCKIKPDSRFAICSCGKRIEHTNWQPREHTRVDATGHKFCIHQTETTKELSCGCGVVYSCGLLNKLCTTRVLPLKLKVYAVDRESSVLLSEENYRWCGGCELRAYPNADTPASG